MAFLRRLLARRNFPLAEFDLQPLAFELGALQPDELLLDRRIVSGPGSNVVTLAKPVLTPGQLRDSIERHLKSRSTSASAPAVDAVDELREALAQVRRSLR